MVRLGEKGAFARATGTWVWCWNAAVDGYRGPGTGAGALRVTNGHPARCAATFPRALPDVPAPLAAGMV